VSLILTSTQNGVTTITLNNPAKLNGWTMRMMDEMKAALRHAGQDAETKVVILTGTDPYYSAGVNLGQTVKPSHPRVLRQQIIEHNEGLFNAFLDFDKPIIAAVNGPAIGASVTSATLCDMLIASDKATFSTPFFRLGVPPEGCSSVLFERLMGDNAKRILGEEGWRPTGTEAAECGLADQVVPHDQLLAQAQRIAEEWIAAGHVRTFRADSTRHELKAVNARESVQVADAFLAAPFLREQYRFLKSKGKRRPAMLFLVLWKSRPLWSRML
jgi:Delta3-Delta2-enoyl-CoA isomerase